MSSNPESSYVPHDVLLKTIFNYSGKTNGARTSETGLLLRQVTNCGVVMSHRFV